MKYLLIIFVKDSNQLNIKQRFQRQVLYEVGPEKNFMDS